MKKRSVGIVLIAIALIMLRLGIGKIDATITKVSYWTVGQGEYIPEDYSDLYKIIFNKDSVDNWEQVFKDYYNGNSMDLINSYIDENINDDKYEVSLYEDSFVPYDTVVFLNLKLKYVQNRSVDYFGIKPFFLRKPSKFYFETKYYEGYKPVYNYDIKNYKGEVVYSAKGLDSNYADSIDLEPGIYYEELKVVKKIEKPSQNSAIYLKRFVLEK